MEEQAQVGGSFDLVKIFVMRPRFYAFLLNRKSQI